MYGTIYGSHRHRTPDTADDDDDDDDDVLIFLSSWQAFRASPRTWGLWGVLILVILKKTGREGGLWDWRDQTLRKLNRILRKVIARKEFTQQLWEKSFSKLGSHFFSWGIFVEGGGSQHCHWYLTDREESDLSTIITLKAAERAAIWEAALLTSAPTNQEIEDLFNWKLIVKDGDDISCLFAAVDNHYEIFKSIL